MEKIKVPDVTVLAVASIRIPGTIRALQICMQDFEWGAAKLISHERPKDLPEEIEFGKCPKIENIDIYNHYVFRNLVEHVETSHCLMVQDHAYIIAPWLWMNEWLKYDYIGAGWPIRENSYIANNGERVRVGNGGFSLRSKKLMSLPRKNNWELRQQQGFYNEDGCINVYYRKEHLKEGIKYAPLDVAVKFSYETPIPENSYGNIHHFAFHRHRSQWMINNGL